MPSAPLRVGSVPYLVGRPLDDGLERESGIEYSRRVPAELVEGLRSGALDVALVSSIELFREEGYRYLAGLAIAGRGAVGSVQLFLRKPLGDVRTIALDPASRTAAALLQVLLAGRAVRFEECARGVDPRNTAADAWLRIGDAALRESLAADAPPVFNPSGEWCARTRLPFVFAAWIVRPGVELAPGQIAAFARARARGKARVAEFARAAAAQWQLAEADCLHYLCEECVYELGPAEMQRALTAFRDGAAPLGLARAELAPQAIAAEPAPAGRSA
jgi:chorismate dehydratase